LSLLHAVSAASRMAAVVTANMRGTRISSPPFPTP
jgi:hypothetical protein